MRERVQSLSFRNSIVEFNLKFRMVVEIPAATHFPILAYPRQQTTSKLSRTKLIQRKIPSTVLCARCRTKAAKTLSEHPYSSLNFLSSLAVAYRTDRSRGRGTRNKNRKKNRRARGGGRGKEIGQSNVKFYRLSTTGWRFN